MGSLNSLREDVARVLEEAGIKSVWYGEKRLTPPLAVVVPDDPYVIASAPGNTFGEWSVGIRVLLIAKGGTSKVAANNIDDMVESAVTALDDHFNITEVNAPGTVDLNGTAYFGSIVSIEANTNFKEDS